MSLSFEKTAQRICKLLEGSPDLVHLEKAYRETLRLRSQLIAAIYDLKPVQITVPDWVAPVGKQFVTLTIPEPLPSMKELTGAVEEHWTAMIHQAIAQEARTGIPFFEKAHVWMEVTTARGTDNRNVWDTSNRAINVVLNNLKGIFFWDDDFEHLSFGITASWGKIGETKIHICSFSDRFSPEKLR